jgi:hypothetical protein
MINTVNNHRYRIELEIIRRRMQENKVKPVDTQNEVSNDSKKSSDEKQSK